MGFSFSKEFSSSKVTVLENSFIKDFLPLASGNAVKVYLYGLFLCNSQTEKSVKDVAETLNIPEKEVLDCLSFWEEFELVSVISKEPLQVEYLPAKSGSYVKPRKFKAEKYTEFSKGLQALLPSRMISTGEFTEYFNIMETYGIKPEAMLMIVKYCIDTKGPNINYKYISTVAKDYGNREITTCEKVEKELSSYLLHQYALEKILSALKLKRKPDIEDLNLFKKWTNVLCFEPDNIIFTAKSIKKGGINKLDAVMHELYSSKCFSKEEISEYLDKKQLVFDLAVKINRALSVYVEVLDTEIDTYVNKWISYGYEENALIFIANECFKKGKSSLVDMDETIENLRKLGVIDLVSICDYYEKEKATYSFIKDVLTIIGINRRPTAWDIDNYNMWKSWNFSDEMILEGAKLSAGKTSPVQYLNAILSNWKNNGVYSVNNITDKAEENRDSLLEYNREYERRRAVAVSRAGENTERAMAINGFSEVYQRMFALEKELAFAEIAGDKATTDALLIEKTSVILKVNEMLSTIGLTLKDLSPVYKCSKCNDTGYVGTERCDCFDK